MLHEALTAAELLAGARDRGGRRRTCRGSTASIASGSTSSSSRPRRSFVVEDHAPVGGLGDVLRRELGGREVSVFGVEGWPAFGTPPEALRFHGLDGASLAGGIAEARALVGA